MLLRTTCLLAIFGTIAGFACGAEEAAAPKITEISLVRSGDGSVAGPEDVLTLRGDGTASYDGKKNVPKIGHYSGNIPHYGFYKSFPLLEKLYQSGRERGYSTGKPTQGVTTVHLRVVRDGKVEEIEDLCPGLDLALWTLEEAVRGVAADIIWKAEQEKASSDASLPGVDLRRAG